MKKWSALGVGARIGSEREESKGKIEMRRTAASGISVSRLAGWRVWVGGSIGSGGELSGMEWMLSIGGIGVDTSEVSGGGMGASSAIVEGAVGMVPRVMFCDEMVKGLEVAEI